MAVGDGGFSTKPMGFDKNEVNEYISNLRKRMNEIEAEKKLNDEKTEAALKQAESADERVKEAQRAGEEKAAQLQAELNAAQRGADNLNSQIESLKTQLEAEKKKMTDMLRSGKGIDSEAKRAYAEVISKAEADAKVIITDAEQTAEKIVSEARQNAAATQEKVSALLDVIRTQLDSMSGGYKSIAETASEVFSASGGAFSADIPDFSAMANAAIEKLEKEEGVTDEAPAKPEPKEEPVPKKEPEPKAKSEEKPAKTVEEAPKAEEKLPASTAEMADAEPDSGDLASFDDDVWGGAAVAKSIYDEAKERQGIPLLNPDRDKSLSLFGAEPEQTGDDDMQSMADLAASLGADMSAESEPVSEVEPMNNDDHAKAAFDSGFSSDLLAQTMNSSNLGDDADDDLLAAIKAQEEKYAVKPRTPVEDLDMDDTPEEGGVSDDEFDFMKTLEDAEKKLRDMGGGNAEFTPEENSSNPWADMQKELEALEQSGGFGGDDVFTQPEPDTPAAPTTDDSNIWNFGTEPTSDSSSDDDMMSSDFGGFGL